MTQFSVGMALRHVNAWLMQPFEKNSLLRKLEAQDIRVELVDQLLGANFPTRNDGILIWLHAATLAQCRDFGEVVAHFEDRDDVNFLWTTEEDDPTGAFDLTGIHQHLPLDHPSFVSSFLQNLRPDALVWLSDSIRPILMRKVVRAKIPAIYANAGMSRAKARNMYGFQISSGFTCPVLIAFWQRQMNPRSAFAKQMRHVPN